MMSLLNNGISSIAIVIYLAPIVLAGGNPHAWSYSGDTGPSHWCHVSEDCCGKRQSPINLDTKTAMKVNFSPLKLHHYSHPVSYMAVTNNGHSVNVETNQTGVGPVMNGGGLGGTYAFGSLHFHWGSENTQGSEHSVDDTFYPLEMHLVHYNTRYGSIQSSVPNTDGLAVLGVLFQLSDKDNPHFAKIFDVFDHVTYMGDSYAIDNPDFSLRELIPDEIGVFYRYLGSLTTPGCNEIVTWTMLKERNSISPAQLRKLRSLFSSTSLETGHRPPLIDNFRPRQKLNGRKVSIRVETSSSSKAIPLSSALTMACVLVTVRLNFLWTS